MSEKTRTENNIIIDREIPHDSRIGVRISLLIGGFAIKSLRIPANIDGRFFFPPDSPKNVAECIFVDNRQGNLFVCTRAPFYIHGPNGEKVRTLQVSDQSLLSISSPDVSCALFTEYIRQEYAALHNYQVVSRSREAAVTIGKNSQNSLVFASPLVSRYHAVLYYKAGKWYISDRGSSNGTYVNGERIREKELHLGDTLYLFGLRIVIGVDFIAVNDLDPRFRLQSSDLIPVAGIRSVPAVPHEPAEHPREYFYRQPRKRMALDAGTITLDAPPMALTNHQIPLLLSMGGSMTYATASMLTGNFMSMISSVIFPVLSQKYTENDRKKYEERRVSKYSQYLEKKGQEIENEQHHEETVLNHNYPAISSVLSYPGSGAHLWERRTRDDDFLTVRLGSGDLPLVSKIEYPKESFNLDEDEMYSQMMQMATRQYMLHNVPVVNSFTEHFVCGITGPRALRNELLLRIILQIAILHSYDEVKLVFLMDQKDLDAFPSIRYLPHVWDDARSMRFIATSEADAFQIGEHLKKEIEEDLKGTQPLKEILRRHPYYVVFGMDRRIFDSIEILKDVMARETSVGISVITAFDDLPKDCSRVFEMHKSGRHHLVHIQEIEKEDILFCLDDYPETAAASGMYDLANRSLKIVTEANNLPKSFTFMEMFGAGTVEQLNPFKRWSENDPSKSLAAPIGVYPDGTTFYLDLHEKFQGPHGLIAGGTGSGKSEFIITYILSMALNYHPDEVAFILIDYKGGGLAGAFDDSARGIHLPHLAGTITNLDGSAIQRSLMSIESELRRRQRIFNKAKSDANTGTMDIYAYQRLYRQGRVDKPLPHLFIISDEFAELKQQEPEFMDELISTARIGRSLGVHLILATQKPAGVVNDQILSNTKFRVCLKVQDRADSMDMLRRPDAAELKVPGRFYLQVGYNEFFALGQSGWSGAPYIPTETVNTRRDNEVQFVDLDGHVLYTGKPAARGVATGQSQIVTIVKALSDLAEREHVGAERLWLDPLPADLALEDLPAIRTERSSKSLPVRIGLVDDPGNQKQFPLDLDFARIQHLMIVGEPGTGKSTLLRTLLYSMVQAYRPDEAQFYLLDFSGKSLWPFRDLPHCGAYLSEEDDDRIDALFDLLVQISRERKQLFAEAEASSFEAYREEHGLAQIFVVIDNAIVLDSMKRGHAYFDALQDFVKAMAPQGIRFIVTINHLNELYSRVRQEFSTVLTLHLKDSYEYGNAMNCRCTYAPPEVKGRGMCLLEERPLEYQAALVCRGSDRQQREYLQERFEELSARYEGIPSARRMAALSMNETYEEFLAGSRPDTLPLGYDTEHMKPVCLPLKQFKALTLYFGNDAGIRTVLDNYLLAARREQMRVIIVRAKENSVYAKEPAVTDAQALSGPGDLCFVDLTPENLQMLTNWLMDELDRRKAPWGAHCAETGQDRQDRDAIYAWLKGRVPPLLILFERYMEFAEACDLKTQNIMRAVFSVAHPLQIRLIGCYLPGDRIDASASMMKTALNPDAMTILYGGQYDKQTLLSLPNSYSSISDPLPLNRCIMHYRKAFYAMTMPCGDLEASEAQIPEDERSIFE